MKTTTLFFLLATATLALSSAETNSKENMLDRLIKSTNDESLHRRLPKKKTTGKKPKPTPKENKKKGRAPGDSGDEKDPDSKGKDKKFAAGDLTIDIKGKSGKFSIERKNLGKGKKKSSVTVEVDSVVEVDSKGKAVGKSGKVKHSMKSLAKQDFTFTVAKEKVSAGENATAKATRVTFDSTLDTGSNLVLETLLISGKGTVGTATETWNVLPGDLKFNIALLNWAWCNPCKEGNGAFVDVELEIKGSKNEPKKREKGKKIHSKDDEKEETKKPKKRRLPKKKPKENKGFDLGDGAILELSDQILIDGTWASMPEGYPKYETKGGKQVYTFRFPKFNDTAFYDPIVGFSSTEADAEADAEAEAEAGSGASLSPASILLAVPASIAIIVSLFF